MVNFRSNLGAYGHNLLAYERDVRGAKWGGVGLDGVGWGRVG